VEKPESGNPESGKPNTTKYSDLPSNEFTNRSPLSTTTKDVAGSGSERESASLLDSNAEEVASYVATCGYLGGEGEI
jgi:hypothetical protein